MARVLYVVLLCVLRLYRDLGAFSPGIILSLDPLKSNFEVLSMNGPIYPICMYWC